MKDYNVELAEFKGLISKIEYIKYTLNSLIYWDKITYMPPAGIEYRTKVMSFFAEEQYRLMSGSAFNKYLRRFKDNKKNDPVTDAMIRRICRDAAYVNKVPEQEYKDYTALIARAEQVWEEARDEDDFERFAPYLEDLFATFRQFAKYWGPTKDPYDALMGYYDESLNVEKVDAIVEQIKPVLMEMLEQNSAEKAGSMEMMRKPLEMPTVDEKRQQAVWEMLLSELGFDFRAGRVDVGAHPTILTNSPSDVRIVNAYSEKDIRSGIFNVLHACGKGLYQQAIDESLLGTFLAEAPSFALEESIGRFYENTLGRSAGFWQYFYDKLCAIVPELSRFGWADLYRDANRMSPSLIRIEAEQFTYLLHIIIRYEIEREVINGRLAVRDIPQAWNDKYEAYLGVRPESDREGVLQDIHWAGGYIGYFPSYFISNLAAAQLGTAIERDCGELNHLTARGEFEVIRGWLEEHVFRHGAVFAGDELITRATGKPLGAEDYIRYLRKRFSEVYTLHH